MHELNRQSTQRRIFTGRQRMLYSDGKLHGAGVTALDTTDGGHLAGVLADHEDQQSVSHQTSVCLVGTDQEDPRGVQTYRRTGRTPDPERS